MQGAEERRLRRMNYTPQGGAIEGNAADDIFLVDQGKITRLTAYASLALTPFEFFRTVESNKRNREGVL